jgi:AcrR family transcriptional regulator
MTGVTIRGVSAKDKTIDRILAAGAKVIGECGMQRARIDDIARHAGVTKQLIHHYYGDKDHLYQAILDASSEDAILTLLSNGYESVDPDEAVKDLFGRIFNQYRDQPERAAMTLDQNLYHCAHISHEGALRNLAPKVLERFEHLLNRGVENGVFRQGINAALYFASSFVLLTGCFFIGRTMQTYLPLDFENEAGVERWREHVLSIIMSGLAAKN